MSTVLLNMSISLDGYVAGPQVTPDQPMGLGGERLHDWLAGTSTADATAAARSRTETGAIVIGRRMFDVGLQFWQDTPYPAPTFVVTHQTRPVLPQPSADFTFVTDGVAAAVTQARAAAGDRITLVMGGADIASQCLRAGLIDEIRLQLVPILLGGGSRLFDGMPPASFQPLQVTHLHYRVTSPDA